MDKIIGFWEKGYYTEVVLLAVLILALATALTNKNQIAGVKFFPIYFGSFLLLFITEYSYYVFFPYTSKVGTTLDHTANFIVTTVELLTFLYFFYHNIISRLIRVGIIITALLTILWFPIVFTDFLRLKMLHDLYIIESLLLLTLGAAYFVEIFKSAPHSKLSNSSSFWIVSGIIIYSVGTLPTTLVTDYVFNLDYQLYANVYSIINLFYIFLFILIIRAYKCKSTNTIFCGSL